MRRLALITVAFLAVSAPSALASDHLMRVDELQLAVGSDLTAQFVELRDGSNEPFPNPGGYRLAAYDAVGNLQGAEALSTSGLQATPTQPYVVGSPSWETATGLTADEDLGQALVGGGGQVCFTRFVAGVDQPIHCLSYGCVSVPVSAESGNEPVPAPFPSGSVQSVTGGFGLGPPTPNDNNAARFSAPVCPPELHEIVVDDGSVFDPTPAGPAAAGSTFHWVWDTDGSGNTDVEHSVTQDAKLFNSGLTDDLQGGFSVGASAGKFPYHCILHQDAGHVGEIRVVPTFGDEYPQPFKVTWATPETTTGDAFDVQYRTSAGGKWKSWQQNTTKLAAKFGRNDKPVAVEDGDIFDFRARSKKSNKPSKRSRWSPAAGIGP